ncbi:hypothetical protein GOP47_0004536, partial [Adiantum capillus-veneris]
LLPSFSSVRRVFPLTRPCHGRRGLKLSNSSRAQPHRYCRVHTIPKNTLLLSSSQLALSAIPISAYRKMSRKGSLQVQVTVPSFFLCPISLELMRDPVTLSSGQTFDRSSIQQWLDDGHHTCPVTRQPIPDSDLEDPIPNHALRRMIQAWCVQNKSCGVERILTPRQPPSLRDIPHLLDLLAPARSSASTNAHESLDALQTLIRIAIERPHSRHTILLSGTLPCLTKLLSRSYPGLAPLAAASPTPMSFTIAEEALKLLDLLIDPELFADFDQQQLHSHEELIMSLANALLRSGTPDSRPRAASILLRLGPSDCLRRKMGQLQGFIAALVEMIQEFDVSSRAALGLLADVCAASNLNRVTAAEVGAVGTLGQFLLCLQQHDSEDKATTEMILRALEVICQCAEGRATVAAEPSILTTVVKHMSAVSERAAHHAVHIVLLVVKWAPEADEMKSAALKEGALIKAIAVAQSATASETRLAARRLAASLSEALPHSHLSHTMRIL